MSEVFFSKLEQMVREKQKETDFLIKEIEELERILSKLYGEVDSLEHVIELLK